jgi:DNA processing protein
VIATAGAEAKRALMHGNGEQPHLELWLRLHCAPGIGPRTASRLLARFGSVEALFAAPPAEFSQLRGGGALPAALHDAAVRARVSAWLDRRHTCGYRVVTRFDAEYPGRLRRTPKAPVVLFVRGNLAPGGPAVAMVGSRRPSDEGIFIASQWAEALARAGVAVVSGLARGIDGASHRGALAGGGVTVAVLGSGPDRIYPREHEKLALAIAASGGAVVSQFWPGTGPDRGLFPSRNATIVGLSDLVLVVEAARESGALVTAELARKMHRPVFAVPGPLSRSSTEGSNELLRSGASMALAPEDILAALGMTAAAPGAAPPALEPELEPLFARIEPGGVSVDRLAQALQWPVGLVLERLLALELRGLVRQLPGQRYTRQR